ncbi:fimbrial protein [Plesiomonas sp.]|uniref:fimbrial protein n=1 Tax=Plesiomonas sp. TaxID=2486279 RepID=UPI003F393803
MNKLSLVSMLVAATLSVSSFTASAENTITFTGTVVGAACEIPAESQSIAVNMGNYDLVSVNAGASKEVPFDIKLTGCNVTALKNAAVVFSGTGSAVTPGLLANNGDAGGAIKLMDDTGTQINLGDMSPSTALIDGDNSLSFKAQYVKDGTDVKAGTINAVANFIVSYS